MQKHWLFALFCFDSSSDVWLSKILTPTLAGVAGFLLLLMIILLYKYKQVSLGRSDCGSGNWSPVDLLN